MLELHLQQLIIIKKINRFKIKITKKWCCLAENALSFTAQYCLSLLGNTHGFHLCNVVPRALANIEQNFLFCIVVWTLKEIIACCVYLCNVVSGVLRQHWIGFFPVQCCLKLLGEYCLRFLPVQSCPKSIKTRLVRIIPVQYWLKRIMTTLKRIFSCAMFLELQRQH